ncbi:MAG: mechanosensitive ion channel [Caldilineaceae bacterium]|jgi:small conductance mechanosensitive channel|nr:mechanosensitive ion channel [Caldilineaceae bacterium]
MSEINPLLAFFFQVVWRIALSVGIAFVARWLAPWSRRRLHPVLLRTALTPALITLAMTAVYYGVWIVAIMTILGLLGFPVQAVLASAGVVAVVLGVALQQSLRDLAATVNFLLFAPFKVGDTIETSGVTGTLLEIQPLSSVILRGDQKTVILPNGQIQQNGIINYSKVGFLRVDMVFRIGYDNDIGQARQIAQQMLEADPRVLRTPQSIIIVLELGESSVNLGVRPFVKAEDYWQVAWDMNERIKLAFDAAGVTIPFPQRDVHLMMAEQ